MSLYYDKNNLPVILPKRLVLCNQHVIVLCGNNVHLYCAENLNPITVEVQLYCAHYPSALYLYGVASHIVLH